MFGIVVTFWRGFVKGKYFWGFISGTGSVTLSTPHLKIFRRFRECINIKISEIRIRTEKLVVDAQKIGFLDFLKLFLGRLQWSAGSSSFLQLTGFIKSNAFFKLHTSTDNVFTANSLPDLMQRSYNIDMRLAPAFTYTPVYKDPKYSFKLQLFLWFLLMHGAIPKLKTGRK